MRPNVLQGWRLYTRRRGKLCQSGPSSAPAKDQAADPNYRLAERDSSPPNSSSSRANLRIILLRGPGLAASVRASVEVREKLPIGCSGCCEFLIPFFGLVS